MLNKYSKLFRITLKYPIYFLQVFTSSKSFIANPLLGNRFLNRAGLHVIRLVLSHTITGFRRWCLSFGIPKQDRDEFRKNGFIVKYQFLPREQFERVNKQNRDLRSEARECIQGDTLTQRILLDSVALKKTPATKELLQQPYFIKLLKYCSAKNAMPILYLQKIKNHYHTSQADPQRDLHSDTFHPTMKAWLFLDDVSDANGPFTYLAGSHKLSWKRLKWEYKQSLKGADLNNVYSARGSLRASPDDLQTMDLLDAKALKVPANTLVIANTHGFHCRGTATERSSRMEIWAYSRYNPFNPFIGLPFPRQPQLEHWLIQRFLAYKDKQAHKAGHASSWHLISHKEFSE